MATIITREVGPTAKGSPLTNAEVDSNFINLNDNKIETGSDAVLSSLQLTGGSGTEGKIQWNSEDGTLDLNLNGGNEVTLQVGQEVLYRVTNRTGSTIPNGTLVSAVGTIGSSGRIEVGLAVADGSLPSKYIMGVATEDIPDDSDGYVTHFGKVRGVNTTGASVGETWVNGDILYANPTQPGQLTKVPPQAPNLKTVIAIVINAHQSVGTLFVRPTYGSNLSQDELVELSSLADGDTIIYNSSAGRFENQNTKLETLETFIAWDDSTDTYDTYASGETDIHRSLRRCLLLNNGTVNYYLDPYDSTKKADGSPSNLLGADGQVMVEVPKFYIKKTLVGRLHTWFISEAPRPGYTLHPAFLKNGVEVSHRYIGAYDASFLDATDGLYKSGLNLNNASSLIDTSEDLLSSVSGVYPLVGVTRAECRALVANRGAGWRVVDQYLIHAIQLLYLSEFGNFNSQAKLGVGNTSGSYLGSSSDQNDSPHSISGLSNFLGSQSTNAITGAGVNAKPGVSFMSYRGIENLFGNCWNWVDGFNILDRQAWMSNNDANFADNTSVGYTQVGQPMPAASNSFVSSIQDLNQAFLASAVGGSSSTFLTDALWTNTGWRGTLFGGSASNSLSAGLFCWDLAFSSGVRLRNAGSRVAF